MNLTGSECMDNFQPGLEFQPGWHRAVMKLAITTGDSGMIISKYLNNLKTIYF
jgi:hypothetical protein